MTIKKQLWEEIESSSDKLLLETLNFLQYLKTKNSTKSKLQKTLDSTGKSLLKHLDSLPNWGETIYQTVFQLSNKLALKLNSTS